MNTDPLQPHPTSHLSRSRTRDGFSAAELLVVVAMLAILATVSLPIFAATFKNARLSGAVRQLASDIRSARSLAISKGGLYGVYTDGNRYRIESSANASTWPSPTVITNWQDVSTQFVGVTVDSVVNGDPIRGPIFNAMGASVGPDGIRSVDVTLTHSGATKIIQVSTAGNVKLP